MNIKDMAKSGVKNKMPKLDCFPSQYKGYEITIKAPEYTSVCPHSRLPDFGTITLKYCPKKLCVELKSFKYYIQAYRDLEIFYENAVNKILLDFVKACKPSWAHITGEFTPRGGISTVIEASLGKRKN